jgi:outer membrane biosynthesis protein TonB
VLFINCWLFIIFLGMTDEVGRQRGGRESRAHSSARREATLGRSKRKVAGTSSLRAEVEEGGTSTVRAEVEEAEAQHPEPVAEEDVEAQGDVEADEQEEEQSEEQEEEQRSDAEEDQVNEAEPPPPPAPKQTKRNRRTTTARNPPKVAKPQVTEFGGGPSDLSLLPSFGGHVAAALWRGEVSFF